MGLGVTKLEELFKIRIGNYSHIYIYIFDNVYLSNSDSGNYG